MPISRSEIYKNIQIILDESRFAVLATDRNGAPYTTLVAFTVNKSLESFYFITSKNTRKYANIKNNNRVSLLIDNRHINPDKTFLITALTVTGRAQIITSPSKIVVKNYILKHPELEDFCKSSSTTFFMIKPERFTFVSRFQEVIEIDSL